MARRTRVYWTDFQVKGYHFKDKNGCVVHISLGGYARQIWCTCHTYTVVHGLMSYRGVNHMDDTVQCFSNFSIKESN